MFSELFERWVYLPVWWNCQDFAIRLGYLLTPSEQTCKVLNSVLRTLRVDMREEVINSRNKTINDRIVIVGIMSPVATIIPPVVTIMGSLLAAASFLALDWRRRTVWEANMRLMEQRYPSLCGLHDELIEVDDICYYKHEKEEMEIMLCGAASFR